MNQTTLSQPTKRNWTINMLLLLSAMVASLSGIYFLFFAHGGFQGGRNPNYRNQLIFSRHTWEDIHLWSGVLLISFALIHIPLHWDWIVGTTKRLGNRLLGRCQGMNHNSKLNILVDVLLGLSFLCAALSGLYFLYEDVAFPAVRSNLRPVLLFSRQVWNLIHTWAGVAFIATATAHIMIHWKWIVKVNGKVLQAFSESNGGVQASEPASTSS